MGKPEEYEVHDQINQAMPGIYGQSFWPMLTYEEGVVMALSWALGLTSEKPMSHPTVSGDKNGA